MDTSRVYLNLKASRTPGTQHASPSSLPPDACRCPRSHRWALKLSCAGLILLLLALIGMSALVRVLIQKPSTGKCTVCIQGNMANPTESPAKLNCTKGWLLHRDKCIHFSQGNNMWKEGLADCSTKGATLLLIRGQEELRLLKDLTNEKDSTFWIGLSYKLSDKNWKWINGSTLSSDVLHITGEAKTDTCAAITKGRVISEDCASDNNWVCQKEPKLISETVCNDA
ncbi:killer cell lectin-like receptor subfamily B member 1A [Phodopus roborovskii]|nr:killer cell lectin-like receptor subfamily B member 1A [Phodopus roborovskii]